MNVVPIVYVTDMTRSIQFYKALGGTPKNQSPAWTELQFGDSTLALHIIDQVPEHRIAGLGLSFASYDRLEKLSERLKSAHISLYQNISDEAFGRSLQVKDPDGLVIQINEHDPDLHQ